MFKVGDRVYDIIFKEYGEVVDVILADDCVEVGFGENIVCYTFDGKIKEIFSQIRSLYFKEFEINIPKEALVRPRWRAPEGDIYAMVDHFGYIIGERESNSPADDRLFSIGNYFKTKEEAANSKFYKAFHEEE